MSDAADAAVPVALAARMDELLAAERADTVNADVMLNAGIAALRDFIKRPEPIHSALDLLAIDGLITSAFARATDAAQLEQLAERARRELFALGDVSA
ncbi:MAG TPA: hypothetical protein VJ717_02625 [Gemmatimonadaceae bacterium]|nr:hypothetical protein [Gemmatimonadaceae bacterium]